MGMTKKQRRMMIGQELFATAAGSIVWGVILGSMVTVVIGKIVGAVNPQYIQYFWLDISTFSAAASAGILEFCIMFFILESLVFYLGLDEVLKFGAKYYFVHVLNIILHSFFFCINV